jgi:hypothetical protein
MLDGGATGGQLVESRWPIVVRDIYRLLPAGYGHRHGVTCFDKHRVTV